MYVCAKLLLPFESSKNSLNIYVRAAEHLRELSSTSVKMRLNIYDKVALCLTFYENGRVLCLTFYNGGDAEDVGKARFPETTVRIPGGKPYVSSPKTYGFVQRKHSSGKNSEFFLADS